MKIDVSNIKDESPKNQNILKDEQILDIWDFKGHVKPRLIVTIKLSLNTSLKWRDVPKFKDDGYVYPIVQVQENGCDLHFKFTPFKGSQKRKVVYMVIENYQQYTALDIINGLEQIGFNTRHSHDAVMKLYKSKGLDLGFVRKTLKDIRL